MPRRDEEQTMPWAPHPDTVIRIGWITAALGFLIAIVSAIGEIRGWWGLVGELGLTFGTLLGILVGIATLAFAATRDQADALLSINQEHSKKLDRLHKLDKLDKLDAIEAAIVGEEGMIRELDAVQLELDMQTGVLDEQLTVLRQIREAL